MKSQLHKDNLLGWEKKKRRQNGMHKIKETKKTH